MLPGLSWLTPANLRPADLSRIAHHCSHYSLHKRKCRFLHLLNRPREYIQLHRDTTVQALTLQPTVKGGVIVYEV